VSQAVTQVTACLENWGMPGYLTAVGETSGNCEKIGKHQFVLLLRVFHCLKNVGMCDSLIADPKCSRC